MLLCYVLIVNITTILVCYVIHVLVYSYYIIIGCNKMEAAQ
jgi:hypothetical protein